MEPTTCRERWLVLHRGEWLCNFIYFLSVGMYVCISVCVRVYLAVSFLSALRNTAGIQGNTLPALAPESVAAAVMVSCGTMLAGRPTAVQLLLLCSTCSEYNRLPSSRTDRVSHLQACRSFKSFCISRSVCGEGKVGRESGADGEEKKECASQKDRFEERRRDTYGGRRWRKKPVLWPIA